MKKKEDKPKKEREIVTAVKGMAYGMALHGMVTYALRLRMHMENLFMLITMGDMLGVPVLPPYYSLRLLPMWFLSSRHGSKRYFAIETLQILCTRAVR